MSFRLADLDRRPPSSSSSSSSGSSSSSSSTSSGRQQHADTPFLFATSSSTHSLAKGKGRLVDGQDDDDDDEEGPFVDPELASQESSRLEEGRGATPRPSPSSRPFDSTSTADDRTPSPTHFLSPDPVPPHDLLPTPITSASSASQSRSRRGGGGRKRRLGKGSGNVRDQIGRLGGQGRYRGARLEGKERALWEWVNVEDLDVFLSQVYDYYLGKGLFCILLARGLNLLTVGFVIVFSTFLLRCIDYSELLARTGLGESWPLEQVLVPRCAASASFGAWLLFLLFLSFYVYQIGSFLTAIPSLLQTHRFYTHLLNIPDEDVQTTSWNRIVSGIERIREENSLTSARDGATKLDAHDIANRLMRQENYLIALLSPSSPSIHSKPRIDLSLALPPWVPASVRSHQWLTRVVVWNLRFCLVGFLFEGGGGEVRKGVLRSKGNKTVLVESLRRRLRFMGIVNAVLGPAIAVYLVVYSFFRYFEEYHKNPSSIGGRAFTPQARWTFREFNELPHLFDKRIEGSLPIAKKYVDQFPKERTTLIMRFVSFVAGSFAAVLLLLTILDPAALLSLEITHNRTVLFYLTLFGGVLAVTRTSNPEGEGKRGFDPEVLMKGVEWFTHWLPEEWEGKLHTTFVLEGFSRLFTFKVVIFLSEILSVFVTPFLLWYTLPDQADDVVDFFREFTVKVEGVGHVCSFAVFDFKKATKGHQGAKGKEWSRKDEAKETRQGKDPAAEKRDNKMEKSFLNFKANNPEWIVQDPSSSIFLSRLQDQHYHHSSILFGNGTRPKALNKHLSPSASRAPGLFPPREGYMLSSNFLAEHNVPAFQPSPLNTSPFHAPHLSTTGRSHGTGGVKVFAAGNGIQSLPLREEEFEEDRQGGWDDVTGTTAGAAGARGSATSDDSESEEEDGREGQVGQDQELLKMLGGIYSTRLGR